MGGEEDWPFPVFNKTSVNVGLPLLQSDATVFLFRIFRAGELFTPLVWKQCYGRQYLRGWSSFRSNLHAFSFLEVWQLLLRGVGLLIYLWFRTPPISQRTERWCSYELGLNSSSVIGRLFYPDYKLAFWKLWFCLCLKQEHFFKNTLLTLENPTHYPTRWFGIGELETFGKGEQIRRMLYNCSFWSLKTLSTQVKRVMPGSSKYSETEWGQNNHF